MSDQVDLLVKILVDSTAREDERHDAIMDIGEFEDDRALKILFQIANNPNENESILDACGESIAQIWMKRNKFNAEIYKKFHLCVQNAIKMYFKKKKPDWLVHFS